MNWQKGKNLNRDKNCEGEIDFLVKQIENPHWEEILKDFYGAVRSDKKSKIGRLKGCFKIKRAQFRRVFDEVAKLSDKLKMGKSKDKDIMETLLQISVIAEDSVERGNAHQPFANFIIRSSKEIINSKDITRSFQNFYKILEVIVALLKNKWEVRKWTSQN